MDSLVMVIDCDLKIKFMALAVPLYFINACAEIYLFCCSA